MNQDMLRAKLHEAAVTVQVQPAIPAYVTRGIRLRQTGIAGGAALSLVALLSVSFLVATLGGPDEVPADRTLPAGVETVIPMAGGQEAGIRWEMALHRTGSGRDAHEGACIVVQRRQTCLELTGFSYGDASIDLRYIRRLDRTLIVVKTQPGLDGPSIRELNGTNWAGLLADPDAGPDAPAYWYRFLEGGDVEGVISVGGESLGFHLHKRGPTVRSGITPASEEYPELSGLPGDKQLVDSGPDGGGYSVIVRRTASELCLHLNDQTECRAADAVDEPLRLWVSKVLPCEPSDDCGSGNDIVIIAGEISRDVTKVGIRDELGTSYVHLGEGPFGGGCCFFSTFLYGNSGDEVELVTYDEDESELSTTPIVY